MKTANVGYDYKHSKDFYINRPFGSGDYVLLVIKSPAFFVLGGKKVISQPNSVIIFKKGTPQFYGAYNSEFVNDWIHFEPDEKDLYEIKSLGISFDTLFCVNNSFELSKFINNMFAEKYSENSHKEESLNLYFKLILLKIAESKKLNNTSKESPHYEMFTKLRNEIYQNPEKEWSIDIICEKLNFSRSYIQHIYKHIFNCSITDDITKSRIEYAKYLLSGTDIPVSLISNSCGYDSDVHFMRMFKKNIGITPSQFRNKTHIEKNETEDGKNKPPFSL